MKTGKITGLFPLLVYYIQRFLVFTVGLRWALDPDKYDLNLEIRKVHLGLWEGLRLRGGARIIFPDKVEHTLTFSEKPFRAMLGNEVAESLVRYTTAWIEVTRLYVLGRHRGTLAKELFRAIYQYGMETGRPILVMVVNDTLLTMFRRYRFAYKVVGAAGLRPANKEERANANGTGLVPHYVLVLNLAVSQATVTSSTLAYFNDGLGQAAPSSGACALWELLTELSSADIDSLVHREPAAGTRVPEVAVAATAAGG